MDQRTPIQRLIEELNQGSCVQLLEVANKSMRINTKHLNNESNLAIIIQVKNQNVNSKQIRKLKENYKKIIIFNYNKQQDFQEASQLLKVLKDHQQYPFTRFYLLYAEGKYQQVVNIFNYSMEQKVLKKLKQGQDLKRKNHYNQSYNIFFK